MKKAERPLRQLHAIVHGRVQGVNFRGYTSQRAAALGVTGWIRNLPDGTVETVAEGSSEVLTAYLDWLNSGPPSSYVEQVDVTWGEATRRFEDFTIRYF